MKRIFCVVVLMSLFAPTASAAIVSVNLTLDTPTPTVNTFTSTLTLDLSFNSPLGTASDSDTATASGTTKMNLDMTFDPATHQVTGISQMEFVQQLLTGPISFDDVSYHLDFYPAAPGYYVLDVNGANVGGTMYTAQTSSSTPGPAMSAVTDNTSFPGTEQYLGLDQGHFVLSGIIPHDWDLSVSNGMAFSAQVDPGTVTVSAPVINGSYATYSVQVVQPIESTLIVWNPNYVSGHPEYGPARLGELVNVGNLVMSGEITRLLPLPGDADENGTVNDLDAAEVAENWLTGPNATWAQGDFNDDGWVNDADAVLMAANWGKIAGVAQTAVPEPAVVAALFWIALAGLAMRRIR